MAKEKTTKRPVRKTTSKRKPSIKDGPEWPTRPMPKIEPGPNAAAISAAIKQIFDERRRKQ